MGFTILKHEAKFIMNKTYVNHNAQESEAYYAYSSIVGGNLCLLIGVRTLSLLRSRYNILPFSGREIDGCKVPSKYTTDFLPVLYIKHSLPIQKLGIWIMTHKW
jgi:hypothetical protein